MNINKEVQNPTNYQSENFIPTSAYFVIDPVNDNKTSSVKWWHTYFTNWIHAQARNYQEVLKNSNILGFKGIAQNTNAANREHHTLTIFLK